MKSPLLFAAAMLSRYPSKHRTLPLQSDLQYVIIPNTAPTIPNAWALQLRFEIAF